MTPSIVKMSNRDPRSLLLLLASALACASASNALSRRQSSAGADTRPGLIDTAVFDRSVRPQDDFFRFVNGRWLATFEIPADRPRFDTWTETILRAQRDRLALIERAAGLNDGPSSPAQVIRDMYRSLLDSAGIERRGISALAGELAPIAAIRTRNDLVRYMGESQPADFYARPFRAYVRPDRQDPNRSIPYVEPGRLRRERELYLDDRNKPLRDAYLHNIERMYSAAGWPHGPEVARMVLALETRLARAMWPAERTRDRVATYNRYSVAKADSLTPHFSWRLFLDGAGLRTNEFVLTQPSFYVTFDSVLVETPLEDWKEYFRYQTVSWRGADLPQAIAQVDLDTWNQLRGQPASTFSRSADAGNVVSEAFPQEFERLYVERFYSQQVGERAAQLVENLRASFREALDSIQWMSPATKAEARRKLDHLRARIGYGTDTVDVSGVVVRPDDAAGNSWRVEQWVYGRSAAELLRPVDRSRFPGNAAWPSASYIEATNEIVLTAAALQPPTFDPNADAAAMYGMFGSLVGHEMGHAFDNRGRRFDASGSMRDWWLPDDQARFNARAARLVAQYDGFTSIDGMHVNGRLTVNENMADLFGLMMAYRAYRHSLGGKKDTIIGGLTGDQRFFVGFARRERGKARDEALRQQLASLPHAPYEYRINGVLMNVPEFYAAFGVQPGDRMYRAPADRVRLW